ncbi:hypothetical protein N7470_001213 [Penicillium chermesinum]|nr:hypothetical protein N7470_001213 [Penicillium chermesinum]
MAFRAVNRRKPRKVGREEEDEEEEEIEQRREPVVKRPGPKSKPKSKGPLSFGAGATSMVEDEDEKTEVVIPKRRGLGPKAAEQSSRQRNITPSVSSEKFSARVGQDQDRPSYNSEYLQELKASTPSAPKPATVEEKAVDIAAKFGELTTMPSQSAIPSHIEIQEKKARRARLANNAQPEEQDFIAVNEYASDEEGWRLESRHEEAQEDTRLVRDDRDFAEGFEEYTEDSGLFLEAKAQREKARQEREAMRELIDDAEGALARRL